MWSSTPLTFSPRSLVPKTSNTTLKAAWSLHVLLLVIAIGCYKAEDKEAVTGIHELFGADAKKYIITVFTQEDDLEFDALQAYIRGAGYLPELAEHCGGQNCALTNRASEEEWPVR